MTSSEQQLRLICTFIQNQVQKIQRMDSASKQQIVFVFDSDDKIPIFDKDEWDSSTHSVQPKKETSSTDNQKVDIEMIKKVKKEIQNTKENFFKVNIVRKKDEKNKQTVRKQNGEKQRLPSLSEKGKNILLEGYLQKRTDGFFFKWHKRYFVLTAQKLYFFSNQKKIQLVGCINLKILPAKLKETQKELVLDFMGECQNIILKAENNEDKKVWKKWLKQVIDFQAKENKVMIKTLVKPLYDSKDTMSEKQFLQTAQTGDILLFYTKNTGAQIQRFLTNSDFDHVAMVIKFKKNEVMVFQSNQMYGVSIYDWRQYVQYFDLYEKITLRKFNYIKKADIQRELLNFVKKNLGRNYEINVNKLLTMESDVNWDQINKQKNENRGYFCSQLIAKALKSVGLLDSKKSSGRYWPVDFAQKSGMLLKKGAFLGPQQAILLNKHLKNYI